MISSKKIFFSLMSVPASSTLFSRQHVQQGSGKQEVVCLTWFGRREGVPSTGVSVRAVWLRALCIVFTIRMDEQAFISKLAVRKNSEGKEIQTSAHTQRKIKQLLHAKARTSHNVENYSRACMCTLVTSTVICGHVTYTT